MKVDKNNSWKEKIDPAFDDLIKVYLDYIKLTHSCSANIHKRCLSLDDESLKVLKRKGYPPLLKEFNEESGSDLEYRIRNSIFLFSKTCACFSLLTYA